VSITGGSITGITDLAVADGGTGASTAAGGLNNLFPRQTGNAIKYLARCDVKGGIDDIKKARHYIDKLVEVRGDDV
jgi:hypothetical protein